MSNVRSRRPAWPCRSTLLRRGLLLSGVSMSLGCGAVDDRDPAVEDPAATQGAQGGDGSGEDPVPGVGGDADSIGSGTAAEGSAGLGDAAEGSAGSGDAPESESDSNADEAGAPGALPPSDGDDEGGPAPDVSRIDREPRLMVAASRLDFGPVGLRQTRERRLEISNRSAEDVVVTARVQAQNGAALGFDLTPDCDGSLPAGSSCVLPVSFTPSALGQWQGTLLVAAEGDELLEVQLTGEGRAPPHFASEETSFDFGAVVVGRAVVHRWVITNDGGVVTNPVSIRFFSAGVSGVDFTFLHDCAEGLQPGSVCNVDVTFAPAAPGVQLGQVNASAASGVVGVSPHQIQLSVRGQGM